MDGQRIPSRCRALGAYTLGRERVSRLAQRLGPPRRPTGRGPAPAARMLEALMPRFSRAVLLSAIAIPIATAFHPMPAAGDPTYEIDWYTIEAGGTLVSAGGNYALGAIIAQPEAGAAATGGDYVL